MSSSTYNPEGLKACVCVSLQSELREDPYKLRHLGELSIAQTELFGFMIMETACIRVVSRLPSAVGIANTRAPPLTHFRKPPTAVITIKTNHLGPT